jgi:hypothetical protein
MRDNLRLSREPNEAKAEANKAESDAELAKCAFRMLAEWAYNERQRLPKDAPDRENAVEASRIQHQTQKGSYPSPTRLNSSLRKRKLNCEFCSPGSGNWQDVMGDSALKLAPTSARLFPWDAPRLLS